MQVWDIFCRVVDNYGDAGVTWRLARQLADEHGVRPRLWVDEPRALAKMRVPLDETAARQMVGGVEVRRWEVGAALEMGPEDVGAQFGEVVIEAFACELPEAYVQAMARRVKEGAAEGKRAPLWLNLEYLSAEPWVEGTHGLASPQNVTLEDGSRVVLNKTFFFPGFTPRTGGLLRERGLLQARAAFQADTPSGRQVQDAHWAALGVPGRAESPAGEWRISMFAYENPAVEDLLAALAEGGTPVRLLVPEGRVLPQVAAFFGAASREADGKVNGKAAGTAEGHASGGAAAKAGDHWQRGALAAHVLPFTDQAGYDKLLWACDLNLVRGEDSFVRAQWAGRPFVWQIYPQAEAAHQVKLAAFWRLYAAGGGVGGAGNAAGKAAGLAPADAAALEAAWAGWNASEADAVAGLPAPDWTAVWAQLRARRAALDAHAGAWAEELAGQADLAAQLVEFSAKVVK